MFDLIQLITVREVTTNYGERYQRYNTGFTFQKDWEENIKILIETYIDDNEIEKKINGIEDNLDKIKGLKDDRNSSEIQRKWIEFDEIIILISFGQKKGNKRQIRYVN